MVTEVNKLKEVANEVEAGGWINFLTARTANNRRYIPATCLSVKWTDYLSSSYSTSRRILKISTIRVVVL